jgi:Spy/CpxP family protein refolding chaperone
LPSCDGSPGVPIAGKAADFENKSVLLAHSFEGVDIMKMGLRLLGVAIAVAVVASASSAMAQRGGQGRGGFGRGGFGGGGSMLLGMEQVQKELDLSDDQKEAIQKVVEESFSARGGERPNFRDMSEEERAKLREEAEARGKEVQKKINDILLPNQRERLAELQIQSRARFGMASALTSPEVADKLKLSDDQKKKLEELAPRFGGFGGGRPRGEGNNNDAPRLSREERDAKAKEVPTSDQLAEFEKMQGKKFEFPEFGRGGQGGRGGRGGEGGERGRRRGQPDA